MGPLFPADLKATKNVIVKIPNGIHILHICLIVILVSVRERIPRMSHPGTLPTPYNYCRRNNRIFLKESKGVFF